MAQIKKETVTNIVVKGSEDFEKSGLRDLVIFELHTQLCVPGKNPAGGAALLGQEYTHGIRYMDFINPYWWDEEPINAWEAPTEADAIRKQKGDILTGFNNGELYSYCPYREPIRKSRHLGSILGKEVIRHFTCSDKLRGMGAIPGSFEIFEISSISKTEVRGALVRYDWMLSDSWHCKPSIEDCIRYWHYGRPERKEVQQLAIKFVNCPTTA